MLTIALSDDATARLYSILKEEEDDACVRVREFKVSTSCNMNLKIVLGLSIDEREDDDIEGEAHSLPFVMNRELCDQYGTHFAVSVNPNTAFAVHPVKPGASPWLARRSPEREEELVWASSIMLP